MSRMQSTQGRQSDRAGNLHEVRRTIGDMKAMLTSLKGTLEGLTDLSESNADIAARLTLAAAQIEMTGRQDAAGEAFSDAELRLNRTRQQMLTLLSRSAMLVNESLALLDEAGSVDLEVPAAGSGDLRDDSADMLADLVRLLDRAEDAAAPKRAPKRGHDFRPASSPLPLQASAE